MGGIKRKTLEETKLDTNKTLNRNWLDKSQDLKKKGGHCLYSTPIHSAGH